MANLQNLKPFQKGHKKLGGRKKGVPNKNSLSLDKVIIAALEQYGSDGQGTGGLVGYFVSILKDPRAGAKLASIILRYEAKHPPKDLAQKEPININKELLALVKKELAQRTKGTRNS
jgi:hypothetical protein